jgi:hypothetical protein
MKAMNSGKPPLYPRRCEDKVMQVVLRPSRKRKAEYDHVSGSQTSEDLQQAKTRG